MDQEFIAHRRERDGEKQLLWDHLHEVSCLAGTFAAKIDLEKHGQLLGLLHDLGKATFEFYQYIGSVTGLIDPDSDDYKIGKKGEIDHSSAGAQVIYRNLSSHDKDNLYASQILPLILASHHSGLIDCVTPDGEDNFSRRMNKQEEKTRTEEALANLDDTIRSELEKLLSDHNLITDLNRKLKLLQEPNDSNETWVFKVGLLIKFLFSCLIDADRLSTADFEFPENKRQRNHGNYVLWELLINRMEKHLKNIENNYQDLSEKQKEINGVRKKISENCLEFTERPRGLYQLTVPTGGGKTLSSLRFALNHAQKNKMDRIIYVIPFTSVIDQNSDVARKILEDKTKEGTYLNNIVLEHHSNLTPDEETTRQKLLAENWDAPVIFTTMVQFLETLFGAGTRSARRMHQLANTVLIFDEIQTLPINCVHLFNIAVRFLIKSCGATVLLCTATQPLLHQVKPDQRALRIGPEQQMMPDVRQLFKDLDRVSVFDWRKPGGWTEKGVAKLVRYELKKTGSVLLVVNTKKAAVNLFQQLRNHPQATVYHLSTNMCPEHRLNNLTEIKKCLSDKKLVICITTPLIEAGVDIDFGTVIRYLAGLDSIVQAAGRCNRNGIRPQGGRVFIINPREENLDFLEDIKIGRDKAQRVLEDFETDPEQFEGNILSEKAIERYYQYYFHEQMGEMSYKVTIKSQVGRDDNLFELLSTNNLSVAAYRRIHQQSYPPLVLRQSFMSAAKSFQAIDSPTRGVIVPYGAEGKNIVAELCAAKDLEKQYRLLRKVQRFSVNVFPYMFEKLVKAEAIREIQKGTGVFYLDERYYSDDYGLSEVPVREMELLNI